MKNLFISNMNEKNVDEFTSDYGLYLRRTLNKPFIKMCNLFTNAHIIKNDNIINKTDEEYFKSLNTNYIPLDNYNIINGKNNIVIERYPELKVGEPYIFVCNHTCPEDIETVLNIIDRNTYLVLGSVESLKSNPDMYLSWLNGMIPFDVLSQKERTELTPKMKRVLKTNSILIFPEGSHNYNPNKLINNLYDGPINLSLETGRKIVNITMVKDFDNNISFIDVSNPFDVKNLKTELDKNELLSEKEKIKSITSIMRDRMATAVYYIMMRHFEELKRNDYENIEENIRLNSIIYAFKKLKWEKDVFDAEYLVKKTTEDKKYEDIIEDMTDIELLKQAKMNFREYVLQSNNLENKDTAKRMRKHFNETKNKH